MPERLVHTSVGLFIFFAALGVPVFWHGTSAADPSCVDSDNGVDFSVMGTIEMGDVVDGVRRNSFIGRDHCQDNWMLIEYKCPAPGGQFSETHRCTYGCDRNTSTCISAPGKDFQTNRKDQICARIMNRLGNNPRRLQQINIRLQKRLDFTCGPVLPPVTDTPRNRVTAVTSASAIADSSGRISRRLLTNTNRSTSNTVRQTMTPSLKALQERAFAGDGNAALELGKRYIDGNGIAADFIEGTVWIAIAYLLKADAIDQAYLGRIADRLREAIQKDPTVAAKHQARWAVLLGKIRNSTSSQSSSSSQSLEEKRNDQRRKDVNTILNAVYQYAIDHSGNLPDGIAESEREICRSDRLGNCPVNMVNLDVLVGIYVVSLPIDPQTTSQVGNSYAIQKASNGRVSVRAPRAEKGMTILVTR